MNKMLLVVSMLLMVMSIGFCQRTMTSTTDYFNVPTAKVLPEGTMAVSVQGAGDNIWGVENNVGALVDVGLVDRWGFTATSDIRDFNRNNVVAGVKFVAGLKDDTSMGGQLALFLYNIGNERTAVPGLSLTVDSTTFDWLSYTAAGWYVDSSWQGGLGATITLNKYINLQAEYTTSDKYVFGVGLSFKNLFGEVRYLDELDEFYGAAGLKFSLW